MIAVKFAKHSMGKLPKISWILETFLNSSMSTRGCYSIFFLENFELDIDNIPYCKIQLVTGRWLNLHHDVVHKSQMISYIAELNHRTGKKSQNAAIYNA